MVETEEARILAALERIATALERQVAQQEEHTRRAEQWRQENVERAEQDRKLVSRSLGINEKTHEVTQDLLKKVEDRIG